MCSIIGVAVTVHVLFMVSLFASPILGAGNTTTTSNTTPSNISITNDKKNIITSSSHNKRNYTKALGKAKPPQPPLQPPRPPPPPPGKVAVVNKRWMVFQRQILTLLNSIHNCKVLNKKDTSKKWSIVDHLKEYENSTRVKKYVERGFNDVEQLFEIFWHNWNNSQLVYKTGIALLEKNINPYELYYGLASVVVNKIESYHKIPPVYDTFSQLLLGRSEDELEIDDITNGLNMKPGIDYYLEDPGLRSFYVDWFLYNPLWWKDAEYKRDRIGELFLYVVHQLYSRYNAARILEGNLKELDDWRIGKIDNKLLKETDDKLKEMVWAAGPQHVENSLQKVGNMILKLFKSSKISFMEHLTVADIESKIGKDLNSFYRILKYIESYSLGVKENLLKPYTETDLQFDGVTLESLKIVYDERNKTIRKDNTFYTKWNYKKYYIKKCDKTATIEKRMSDHEEFFYEMQIESLLDVPTKAIVNIFLGPKYDFEGRPVLPDEYQKYMFQMDHFEIVLKNGENKLRRSSKRSTLFSKGDSPYVKQIQELTDVEAGYVQLTVANKKQINCGLPSNLLIPQGGHQHHNKLLLFASITKSSSRGGIDANTFTICRGGNSTTAFGFPFDRGFEPENLLMDMNNFKMIQVGSIMAANVFSESL